MVSLWLPNTGDLVGGTSCTGIHAAGAYHGSHQFRYTHRARHEAPPPRSCHATPLAASVSLQSGQVLNSPGKGKLQCPISVRLTPPVHPRICPVTRSARRAAGHAAAGRCQRGLTSHLLLHLPLLLPAVPDHARDCSSRGQGRPGRGARARVLASSCSHHSTARLLLAPRPVCVLLGHAGHHPQAIVVLRQSCGNTHPAAGVAHLRQGLLGGWRVWLAGHGLHAAGRARHHRA